MHNENKREAEPSLGYRGKTFTYQIVAIDFEELG